MKIGHVEVFDEVIRFLKILFRFTRKTDNDIDPDAAVRHQIFNFFHALGVQFSLVTATHLCQLFVVAALQRNMKVRYKQVGLCDKFNNFVGQQVGFDTRNAKAFYVFDLIQFFNQINKQSLFFGACAFDDLRAVAEIADIHTRQHDFFRACRRNTFSVFDNALYSVAATRTARLRYGAKSTFIITTVLHFEKGASAVTERKRIDKVFGGLHFAGNDHTLARRFGQLVEVVQNPKFFRCAEYQIDALYLGDFVGFELRVAADDDD